MQNKLLKSQDDEAVFLGKKIYNLRYGENPHQKAGIYSIKDDKSLFYEKLYGKELSYNNLNDLKLGLKLSAEFNLPSCVIIKHAIPSSVADQKHFGSVE